MKYVILLADGMADRPLPQLQGRTPLAAAATPNMDKLAPLSTVGLAHTVPEGMPPGSDTANLSVMGYAPERYYTGRSPLEALSIGVDLQPQDVAIRCNLVTLSGQPRLEDNLMVDYAAGEISTDESRQLIAALAQEFDDSHTKLYAGVSYRHCLVLSPGQTGTQLTPPHDFTGKPLAGRLPQGLNGARLTQLIDRSRSILAQHPVNQARRAKGLRTADAVWFWGEGVKPALDPFEQLYGLKAGVVCAVDLLRGLGLAAGMRVLTPEGATGGMVTDYTAKAQAALRLLKEGCDLVYIHVEAPDECGHQGQIDAKVEAISQIDGMLGQLLTGLQGQDARILVTCDHPTPIEIRTHCSDPVPFLIWDSRAAGQPSVTQFSEATAAATGLYLEKGPQLMELLVKA